MKQTFKCLFAAFAAMLVAVSAFAQITTSSLGGRITDANGEPVIGAAVVATHEPSGTVYGVTTNTDGRYAMNGMRSGGPYKVEVSCLGYKPLTYTDVNLQLAEAYALNGSLQDDSQMLGEAIVVAAPASKFAAEKTGAATNISSQQMTSLPTISRNLTDVTRLSPYGGNGMTFGGVDGRTANFTVDGANFNNNFGLSDGLPGGGNPISLDAIEEMQVVISPYDVRQTNFIGGGVNAITKSGTNTLKGSAYVYHRNENMRGNMAAGKEVSGARDKDRNTTYGFTLGGPIIKNKLFFFVNAEYSTIPTVVNRWRGSVDGVENADANISRTTLADLEKVSNFVKEKYGYDTGSWTDFPATESNMKLLARIDWNINDNHKLAVRYNYTLNQAWNSTNASSMDGGPPIDENIAKTKELVEVCNSKGLSLEAEVGAIGGEEDGVIGSGEVADPKECKMIADLGVTMLAAGIGNIHGKYPENWAGLRFDVLESISNEVGADMPLVLHGGTGIPADMIKTAISLGVSKINVNTECQLAFAAATRKYVEEGKDLCGKGFDPRKLLAPGVEAIKATVREKIELFGSANKA